MIKVGQIRKPTKEFKDDPKGNTKIVISKIDDEGWCSVIFEDGDVIASSPDWIVEEKTELIAEYSSWQDAVSSPEFIGENNKEDKLANDLKQIVRDSAKQIREIIDDWSKGGNNVW